MPANATPTDNLTNIATDVEAVLAYADRLIEVYRMLCSAGGGVTPRFFMVRALHSLHDIKLNMAVAGHRALPGMVNAISHVETGLSYDADPSGYARDARDEILPVIAKYELLGGRIRTLTPAD